MTDYSQYDIQSNDPYLIENSTCLINNLGILDTEKLLAAEEEITASAYAELIKSPVNPTFDLNHLWFIHQRFLGDIYPWAGKTRTTEIAERAAFYLGQINMMHPFREGNGRTQRIFLDQLAECSGYGFEWSSVSGEKMAHACRAARQDPADYQLLINLINLIIVKFWAFYAEYSFFPLA